MIQVAVRRSGVRYPVRVEAGLLDRIGPLVRPLASDGRVLLVTDRVVGRLYGRRAVRSLHGARLDVVRSILPAGERAKSLDHVGALCAAWARAEAGRGSLVLALGGGVVSDVAGFAAASYARGIPWVVVPTTLLSQVDASIGGKVGVNLPSGKNLVGAFHHPRAVFADPDLLATLTPRAIRSGLAEVVKIGVIRRAGILRRLEARMAGQRPLATDDLADLIRESAAAKAWYVTRDERDQGPRRELNFGHTVGHALEAASGYRIYEHGEAVSVGMVAALRLSVRLAGLPPDDATRVERLLERLGLPTRLKGRAGPRLWDAIRKDKKRGRSGVRVVLCPAIGRAEVHDLTSLTTLRRVLSSLASLP